MEFTSRSVGIALGLDPTGFRRIETGINQPRPETARKLDEFFGGLLPYGMYFDPYNDRYLDWFSKRRCARLRTRAKKVREQYPQVRRTP